MTSLLFLSAFVLVVVLCPSRAASFASFRVDSKSQHEGGVLQLVKAPECVLDATKKLETCQALSEVDAQRRYTLQLLNCHLSDSGRPIIVCPDTMDWPACSAGMDNATFHTFVLLTANVQEVCFHAQAELWRAATSSAVSSLYEAAVVMAEKQEAALSNQARLLDADVALLESLTNATSRVHRMEAATRASFARLTTEMSANLKDVDAALGEVASYAQLILRIQSQSFVLHAVLFYAASFVCVFFVTSAAATRRARLPLILGLAVTAWADLTMVRGLATASTLFRDPTDAQHALRSGFGAYATVCVLLSMWLYKDMEQVNHQLLVQILAQLAKMGEGGNKGTDDGEADPSDGTLVKVDRSNGPQPSALDMWDWSTDSEDYEPGSSDDDDEEEEEEEDDVEDDLEEEDEV